MSSRSNKLEQAVSRHYHFSKIAGNYRDLRVTDTEPVLFIAEQLKALRHLPHIDAADIGCGAGRYDLLLVRHLGMLRLKCIDVNERMLKSLTEHMMAHGVNNFSTIRSGAEQLPLASGSLDSVVTFNAIHHFDAPAFLRECARVMRQDSYLFVYTRTPEQNRRNIWGRHFPLFAEKETRLHEAETLREMVAGVPDLRLQSVELFEYQRGSSLGRLEYLAGHKHYSTFSLYTNEELKVALNGFRDNVKECHPDLDEVRWVDGNILLAIRKCK